jgi:hypothetical protein
MSKITVWKCDTTGKLFEDYRKYRNHLRREARARVAQRKLQIETDALEEFFLNLQNSVETFDELVDAIFKNEMALWAAVKRDSSWNGDWNLIGKRTRKGVVFPMPKLREVIFEDMRYSTQISNSHDCPKGGVTSNSRDPSVPRGYPGWGGRVTLIIDWPEEWSGWYLGSKLFEPRLFCIHTGTGGGGSNAHNLKNTQKFSWDVRVFEADWPAMARRREKEIMWTTLGGKEPVC